MLESPGKRLRLLTNFTFILFAAALAAAVDKEKDKSAQRGLSPVESLGMMTTPDDLQVELVLSEPKIGQPVFFNFDERGRMWVVQYLQYPVPAGLKIRSRDRHWRIVYDKVPAAPGKPGFVPGRDKITIHEDTDGDGTFDRHKVFLEGLSIVTSLARGRGGVWVLQPPYLLFYDDADNDDVPDGPPEVHLSGFGLEDTHSVTNSLRWGPDGWLYAAQGSTVSGRIVQPGVDAPPVFSQGQLIWRYHPETRRFEIFAEGGGNAFGVEIDRKGRIYSGHNGGDTRGFHYVQGGYFRKGFSKHGPLSNPYAFGYFDHMPHHKVRRFTHNFVIYEGNALPQKYRGKLIGIDPLNRNLPLAELTPTGSTFRTKDVGFAVTIEDQWSRPVDIKTGPDGAVYFADFYEQHPSHRQHFEGKIGRDTGRIYRLRGKDAQPVTTPELGALPNEKLVALLRHKNRWHRQTALRLIADGKDKSLAGKLVEMIESEDSQAALEALWALNLIGAFDDARAIVAMQHADPHVRAWAVRLACDDREISTTVLQTLLTLTQGEDHVEVRAQIACSARRLSVESSLQLLEALITSGSDHDDPYLPLLVWWLTETNCSREPQQVVRLFGKTSLWQRSLVRDHLLERLMRRFAATGRRQDYLRCAELLATAPNEQSRARLIKGFEAGVAGRSLVNLPAALVAALTRAGKASLALRLRLGTDDSVSQALKFAADASADAKQRCAVIEVFGQIDEPKCKPILLDIVRQEKNTSVKQAALMALQNYDDAKIAAAILEAYGRMSRDEQHIAQTLLLARKSWASQLLDAIDAGKIDPLSLSHTTIRGFGVHKDNALKQRVRRRWGQLEGQTSAELKEQVARVRDIVETGSGDPLNGRTLYRKECGKCHRLFEDGGHIGPDLTAYRRDDVDRLLLNIIDPSSEIRAGFENYLVETEDGRIVTGLLVDRDDQILVIRDASGGTTAIERKEIVETELQRTSLMPSGLLGSYSDQQLRDLFAYLRSGQPLNY